MTNSDRSPLHAVDRSPVSRGQMADEVAELMGDPNLDAVSQSILSNLAPFLIAAERVADETIAQAARQTFRVIDGTKDD